MRHERDGAGLRTPARAWPWRWILAAALAATAVALLPLALRGVVAGRLREAAAARQLTATWTSLETAYPARVRVRGLVLTRTPRDTALWAGDAEVSLAFAWPPRAASVSLRDAAVSLGAADDDEDGDEAWSPEPDAGGGRDRPADPRVRAAAQQLARALLLPARQLPELRLVRVDLRRGGRGAWIEALEVSHRQARFQLSGNGTLRLADAVPFEVHANWRDDDHFGAQARFTLDDSLTGRPQALVLTLGGRLTQDRAAGELRLAEGATLTVGALPFTLSGLVRRQGPRFEGALQGEDLSPEAIRASAPRALLGPLDDLRVDGTFDWSARLALDVSRPDSVRFDARVRPRGLALAADSPLPLRALNGPFTARIHVRGGTVTRELSPGNPGYRPLARIAPTLRDAVLTNEDGGFWWHRGFNTQAIRLAMADNLRAGRFKRGAGTITMQLVRNLYLGQQKTLARKGQEVVLAWTLEHLARVPKERLLEIYLNIIEWGPGVHGAAEAAAYYFGKDPADLTLDESLFLATLVPSPRRWPNRLTPQGELRPWVRSQMRFIAGKMGSKGWLDSAQVVPAESLSVRLTGPAGARFAARDTAAAAPDSARSDAADAL